jgi:hypothetical protein
MSFSAKRCAYCPRPSFSSQSATCCIAAAPRIIGPQPARSASLSLMGTALESRRPDGLCRRGYRVAPRPGKRTGGLGDGAATALSASAASTRTPRAGSGAAVAGPRVLTTAVGGRHDLGERASRWQQRKAKERAEGLRSVFERLSSLSAKKAAEELNARGIPPPLCGNWSATQVIRVRERLSQRA